MKSVNNFKKRETWPKEGQNMKSILNVPLFFFFFFVFFSGFWFGPDGDTIAIHALIGLWGDFDARVHGNSVFQLGVCRVNNPSLSFI